MDVDRSSNKHDGQASKAELNMLEIVEAGATQQNMGILRDYSYTCRAMRDCLKVASHTWTTLLSFIDTPKWE